MFSASVSIGDCNIFNPPSFVHVHVGNLPRRRVCRMGKKGMGKILLLILRGVEYNDIRIEPEKKKIGLIAQEVELIIPEVVRTDEQTSLKSIEDQNLVGLLIEAIKELNNKVLNLEKILKNNNLY